MTVQPDRRVPQAHPVRPVLRAITALPDRPGHLGPQARTARTVRTAQGVRPGPRVPRVRTALRVRRVELVLRVLRARLVPPVLKASQVRQVLPAPRVTTASPDRKVPQAHLAPRAPRAPRAITALPDRPGHLGPQARTARTVRTAQGVRRGPRGQREPQGQRVPRVRQGRRVQRDHRWRRMKLSSTPRFQVQRPRCRAQRIMLPSAVAKPGRSECSEDRFFPVRSIPRIRCRQRLDRLRTHRVRLDGTSKRQLVQLPCTQSALSSSALHLRGAPAGRPRERVLLCGPHLMFDGGARELLLSALTSFELPLSAIT